MSVHVTFPLPVSVTVTCNVPVLVCAPLDVVDAVTVDDDVPDNVIPAPPEMNAHAYVNDPTPFDTVACDVPDSPVDESDPGATATSASISGADTVAVITADAVVIELDEPDEELVPFAFVAVTLNV